MQDHLAVAPGLALLFDMDGVLIESTGVHTAAWEEYLARHGIPSAGVMEKMLGRRNDQIVRILWGPQITEEEVFRHGAEKERLYREMMSPVFEQHIVPGVEGFVRAASSRGVPCALATNAEPANVDFVLGRLGLRECFRVIVDGHQVRRPKPDPEVYLTAAARLGVAPQNCVIFEDSPGGLQAARAAGGRVVAVLTTLKQAPDADLAVRDFLDPSLRSWLSRQTPR
ncbi:MAG: HAD family phosphatase [Bryobacteraceae bacterium]|jgi:HAD superfamily hydrolase (TIGR01509 family)